jgi:hypothetical protein
VETAAMQVQQSVLDEGAYIHPDLWPDLGVINVNPDTCSWSAVQLRGSTISTGQLTCISWKRRAFQTCRRSQERRCRGS